MPVRKSIQSSDRPCAYTCHLFIVAASSSFNTGEVRKRGEERLSVASRFESLSLAASHRASKWWVVPLALPSP